METYLLINERKLHDSYESNFRIRNLQFSPYMYARTLFSHILVSLFATAKVSIRVSLIVIDYRP
jgi:hypothetical protein